MSLNIFTFNAWELKIKKINQGKQDQRSLNIFTFIAWEVKTKKRNQEKLSKFFSFFVKIKKNDDKKYKFIKHFLEYKNKNNIKYIMRDIITCSNNMITWSFK